MIGAPASIEQILVSNIYDFGNGQTKQMSELSQTFQDNLRDFGFDLAPYLNAVSASMNEVGPVNQTGLED